MPDRVRGACDADRSRSAIVPPHFAPRPRAGYRPPRCRYNSRGRSQPATGKGERSMSTIESVLQEKRLFPPPEAFVRQANVSGMEAYRALCDEAARDYPGYWARLAREHILWHKPFTRALDESEAPFFKWFQDGELNVSYNCLDRHLKSQPNKVAIIFEADDGAIT